MIYRKKYLFFLQLTRYIYEKFKYIQLHIHHHSSPNPWTFLREKRSGMIFGLLSSVLREGDFSVPPKDRAIAAMKLKDGYSLETKL